MTRLRSWSLVSVVFLCLVLPLSSHAQVHAADVDREARCSDMQDAQVPGFDAGSACRMAVEVEDTSLLGAASRFLQHGLAGLMSFYRYGQTYEYTSNSSSDISEDVINVDAWLYISLASLPGWTFEDDCEDHNTNTFNAACRTYSIGCYDRKQIGSHFFHTDGWYDTTLGTVDYWNCD